MASGACVTVLSKKKVPKERILRGKTYIYLVHVHAEVEWILGVFEDGRDR